MGNRFMQMPVRYARGNALRMHTTQRPCRGQPGCLTEFETTVRRELTP